MHIIMEDSAGVVVADFDLDDATAKQLMELAEARNSTVEDVILEAVVNELME